MKKLIKLSNGITKEMDSEEVFIQFRSFIYKIASGFVTQYDRLDDLFQVGCIGLLKAYKAYDAKKNIKFMTLLNPVVMNELRMYKRSKKNYVVDISMETVIIKDNDGSGYTFMDLLCDPNNFEEDIIDHEQYLEVIKLIDKLPEKQRNIFYEIIIRERKQIEVAEELGISQSHISRMVRRGLKKIKMKYEVQNEKDICFRKN